MLTDYQKAYIKANYSTTTDTEIAYKLGLRKETIQNYRQRNGLIKDMKTVLALSGHTDTLCWTCRCAGLDCHKPVQGWNAKYAPIVSKQGLLDSWLVISCPKYVSDKRVASSRN